MDMSWDCMIKAERRTGEKRKEFHSASYLLGFQDTCFTTCKSSHFQTNVAEAIKAQNAGLRIKWTNILTSFDEHPSELKWQQILEAFKHWLIPLWLIFASLYQGQWFIMIKTVKRGLYLQLLAKFTLNSFGRDNNWLWERGWWIVSFLDAVI